MKEFIIIHLTDIHGAGHLLERIGNEIEKSDMVLLSGDITHFGKEKEAQNIIETLQVLNPHIYAVTGNCDYPEVEVYLKRKNISVNRSIKQYSEYVLTGISGSLPCPGQTPCEYTEEAAENWLSEIAGNIEPGKPLIFIPHQPPFNTSCDDLGNNYHVGSKAIRNFILRIRPILCTTGHIHEGIGIDSIDHCTIVNPGPFRNGRYARITITKKESYHVTVDLKQLAMTD